MSFKDPYFAHALHDAVVTAAQDGMTFYGLRATAMRLLAEAGCTDREIMAATGYSTSAMVTRCLRNAAPPTSGRAVVLKLATRHAEKG